MYSNGIAAFLCEQNKEVSWLHINVQPLYTDLHVPINTHRGHFNPQVYNNNNEFDLDLSSHTHTHMHNIYHKSIFRLNISISSHVW